MSDQRQSSCTPTPILIYDTLYGAGVDPARVPRPSLVELPDQKGLMIIAQQLPKETWRGLPRCSRVTLRGEGGGHCCAVMIQSPRDIMENFVVDRLPEAVVTVLRAQTHPESRERLPPS